MSEPLDLERIRQRVALARFIWGDDFADHDDEPPREPIDIQRDRDRAALLAEVDRLIGTQERAR